MRRRFSIWGMIAVSIVVCVMMAGCGAKQQANSSGTSYRIVDSRGATVELTKKPQKIVTLSAGTDQILLGMVSTQRLAAINALLDDPVSSNIVAKAKKIPVKIHIPSAEQLLAMQPDLVIAPDWISEEIVGMLRDAGLQVIVCKGAKNAEDVQGNIRLIAKAIGEEEQGNRLLAAMDAKLAEIQQKTAAIPLEQRKKVVLISLMSTYGGSGCIFDDMCRRANVINGLAAAGIQSGQNFNKEQLVAINPDLLILPAYNDHGNYDIESYRREFLEDPSLQTLRAIREKNLYLPREGYIYNSSQDMVFGVQEVAYAAYGDEFAQPADRHLSVSGE